MLIKIRSKGVYAIYGNKSGCLLCHNKTIHFFLYPYSRIRVSLAVHDMDFMVDEMELNIYQNLVSGVFNSGQFLRLGMIHIVKQYIVVIIYLIP